VKCVLWSRRAQGIYQERKGLEGGARKDNHTAPRQQGRRDTGKRKLPENIPGGYYPSDVIPSKKHLEGILEGILQTSSHEVTCPSWERFRSTNLASRFHHPPTLLSPPVCTATGVRGNRNNTPRSHLRGRCGHMPQWGTPRGVSVPPRQQAPPAGGPTAALPHPDGG
jgi:hypothetical protein